jgi:hypothetical protein
LTDDKPVWSRKGRSIYFVSRRRGFFNVRGIRFDPSTGRPVGDTFPVTSFDSPNLMVPDFIQDGGTIAYTRPPYRDGGASFRSIWLLDNVDR